MVDASGTVTAVEQKRLTKTTPLPGIVRDAGSDILAEDDTFTEHSRCVALHPLDPFRTFVALRSNGQVDEEIAAAFFVVPQIVKQRLRLHSVARPCLRSMPRIESRWNISSPSLQTKIKTVKFRSWIQSIRSGTRVPYQIRRMLPEASDRHTVFVGVDAYRAAGDRMLNDLFQGDDGGWLEDPALLHRVMAEKQQAETETIAVDSWKWIEVSIDRPYGYSQARRLSLLAHCLVDTYLNRVRKARSIEAVREAKRGGDCTPS